MIQIDEVDFIPDLPYTKKGLEGVTREAWIGLGNGSKIYVAREGKVPLFCIGVYLPNFLSLPYLWLIPCEGLASRHLRELREIFLRDYPGAGYILINKDSQNIKFAKFFGLLVTRTDGDLFRMER